MRRGLQREKVGRRNRRHGRTGEVLHVPRDDVFAAGFLGGNRDNGVLVVRKSKCARVEEDLPVAGNDGNALVENQAEGVILAGAVAMAAADGKREISLVYKMQELCKAVKAVAENTPTVDAVEVVRCRDCKWYMPGDLFTDIMFCHRLKKDNGKPAKYNYCADDFCSYGERKDGDRNG